MDEKLTFSLVIISLIILLGSLFVLSFFSYGKIRDLDDIKFESRNLLNDWKNVEIFTLDLLITNNIRSTRKELGFVKKSFDERLSNFVELPEVRTISKDDIEFDSNLKIVEKLWKLNEEKLDSIGISLNRYVLDEGINGELLIKFGEQRATRIYSFEQKQLIDEIKSVTSLSDKSFISVLDNLVFQINEEIENRVLRFTVIFLVLTLILILILFIIVYSFIQGIRAHAKNLSEEIVMRKKTEENLRKKSSELEKFAKVAIGREEKMIELKKQIRGMER